MEVFRDVLKEMMSDETSPQWFLQAVLDADGTTLYNWIKFSLKNNEDMAINASFKQLETAIQDTKKRLDYNFM